MSKWKFYLLLPMLAVLAFGSVSFAQEIDKEALKAELRAELKAELKQELMADLKSETKASVQEATVGLRDVMKKDFADEIRAEIMQEDIAGAVEEALAGSAIMGGMFNGMTAGGFIDTNFMYNLRHHGENQSSSRNKTDILNFVGENEDNTWALENFAMFWDKGTTDDDPLGWQMHTYWGEKAQRITFLGPGNDTTATAADGNAGAARRFSIATANITWNAPVLGKTVPITMGKMYTWIGFELVENIGNPNYTHSQSYNNSIPFTHMGMSFDVSEFLNNDAWGLTLYAVNGWDSYIDSTEGKSYGAYLTYAPNDDFFFSLAAIHGPEQFGAQTESDDTMMYDVVVTYSLPQINKLSIAANWDHGYMENQKTEDHAGILPAGHTTAIPSRTGAHWWSLGTYAMYDFTDNQMGALRYEYWNDADGAKGYGHTLWTLTYTHNITIADNLMLRPEIRYNNYNVETANEYTHDTDGANGTFDDETILGMGVEYIF
jgi:hypothetical protein